MWLAGWGGWRRTIGEAWPVTRLGPDENRKQPDPGPFFLFFFLFPLQSQATLLGESENPNFTKSGPKYKGD